IGKCCQSLPLLSGRVDTNRVSPRIFENQIRFYPLLPEPSVPRAASEPVPVCGTFRSARFAFNASTSDFGIYRLNVSMLQPGQNSLPRKNVTPRLRTPALNRN